MESDGRCTMMNKVILCKYCLVVCHKRPESATCRIRSAPSLYKSYGCNSNKLGWNNLRRCDDICCEFIYDLIDLKVKCVLHSEMESGAR